MKAIDSRQPYSLAARVLKIVGIILIVSSVLDFAVVMFPPNFLDRQWQIALTARLVDRGIIPMVGLALLFAGFGIESAAGLANPNRRTLLDLKFWSLLLSSFLGLVFLLLFPLHVNNISLARSQAIDRINAEANLAENQFQTQITNPEAKKKIESQLREALKTRIEQVIGDEQKFNETLKSDKTPEAQKNLLRRFKEDPKAIEEFVEQQQVNPDALLNQQLTEFRGSKEKKIEQIKMESLKAGLQTGVSSLLLAAGYIAIGWSGLKGLGYLSVGRRKAPVR